jgi:hypothetical protein
MRRIIVGFHINQYSMPVLNNYETAKEHFKNTAPVRGENQSIRRLGDRYAREKWLRQEIKDGVEVYVAGYYNTDLVAFYPTHKSITLGGFPSYSTKRFVERIANVWLVEFEHKRYVPAPFTKQPNVVNNEIECALSLNGYKHMDAYTWYRIEYDHNTDEEQYIKPKKCRIDTSQLRELRKPYRNLIKYVDTLIKLGNAGVEHDMKLSDQLPEERNYVEKYTQLLEFMKDENNMYLSYYYLARQTQRQTWSNDGSKYHITIGMVKRFLDKLLKLHNPQVLVEVEPATKV